MKNPFKKIPGFWPLSISRLAKTKQDKMIDGLIARLPEIQSALRKVEQDTLKSKRMGAMFDFYESYLDHIRGNDDWPIDPSIHNVIDGAKDKRISAKPVEVVSELQTVPLPFTMKGLEKKIKLFEDKSEIAIQRYSLDQIKGFLQCLKNRKKYNEHKSFYQQFPNTTTEKIDSLLAKYKLVMCKSELFIPTFPEEAIDVMKAYSDITQQIACEKPVFYVIAEEADFGEKQKKLDPILLAQSPFGFYWQVLGAWDKEMLLLDEL